MREKATVIGGANQNCGQPGTKRLATRGSLVLCVLVLAASAHLGFAADTSPAKNVLVLYSFTDGDAQSDLEVLKSSTRSHVGTPVDFHVEYLGSSRFDAPGYEQGVSESLASVYGGKKIDLVITSFYPAFRFAVDHREEIFPGVPILFTSVPRRRLDGRKIGPRVAGITMNFDIQGTIDLALRLQPDSRNAAVIAGAAEPDRYWLAVINQELRRYQSTLSVTDLVGLPPERLLERVKALPPHTFVLFQEVPEGAVQPVVGSFDVISVIAHQFPTYCFVKRCMGHGTIGGVYPDAVEQAREAGEMAERILSGETPESIPVMEGPPALAQVDWRQLRRWNMPETALPLGAVVLYRPPTLLAHYAKYFGAGLLLILVQAGLILGLLLQRARSRKVDLRLRESEERFRLMADTTPALVWMCDQEGTVTYLNDRRIDFTGRDLAAGFGDVWSAFIHPDDLQHVLKANAKALQQRKEYSKEYRLRRRDGVYRWMLDTAAPRVNGDGSFAGFVGSAADITDQKLAREELEKIGGKLIEAQEEERTRIARELHDDICQRLALLSMELEQANRNTSGSKGSPKLEEIRKHCAEIAGDVQALSHKLHSSKLEYLGLAAAIRGFGREFSQQHNLSVQFAEENVPRYLPRDISLALFRVTQEALQNALKHSGASQFSVALRGSANEIQLEVSDQGTGFNVEEAKWDKGLGLVSMQERVHLVHGVFTVQSTRDSGTTILVRVPLVAEVDSSATAAASA